jgi:two-component system response regulator
MGQLRASDHHQCLDMRALSTKAAQTQLKTPRKSVKHGISLPSSDGMVCVEPTNFLLVEDNSNDVYLVQHAFRRAKNCHLFVVSDGEEAVEYMIGKGKFSDRAEYPLPQVILLDIKLPKMSGLEFLEWLRKKSPGTQHVVPVIVMSSSNLEKDVQHAYELGVNLYMVKPVNWRQFEERMKLLNMLWSAHVEKPHVN